VFGPALGGLIYGFGNVTAAYVVDASLMLAALALDTETRSTALTARAPSSQARPPRGLATGRLLGERVSIFGCILRCLRG